MTKQSTLRSLTTLAIVLMIGTLPGCAATTDVPAEGEKRATSGNQMALANIRQRFDLAYGHRASVEVEDSGSEYAVRLRFPHDESRV